MYLKRLEMQGFKSFADKISLDFGEGITAIVGPNGSGKSNISDAIRWVLGEQSPKSLRGSKMEDVIFSGTAKRKPTGFAQVSLTLDNSDRLFPIDYDEICITRRVYRSGESEYFINKAACRLRDIHELFMDTGLGRDGYSIIGQGKIDGILSGKPEERRQIFEEAAGISKYKAKKTEAERKLSSTEDNLARINDILGELKERISPLEKQSERARKYLRFYEEAKELDISICADSLEKLLSEEENLSETLGNTTDAVQSEETKLKELQENEKTLYSSMRRTDADIEGVKEEIHKIDILNTRIEGEISLIENNIKALKDEIEKSNSDISTLESEAEGHSAQIKIILEEIDALEEKRKSQLDIIDKKNESVTSISNGTDALNRRLSQLYEDRNALVKDKEELKTRINTIEALGNSVSERQAALKSTIDETGRELAQNSEREQAISLELSSLKKEIDIFHLNYTKNLEKAKRLQDETNALKKTYNQKNAEYNQAVSRLSALRDMEKNMDGYGAGQRALLSPHFNESVKIHGVVSKLIALDDKYTTAVEASVGNALQNVVVDSDTDARKAIDFLKKNRLGRVTFLPIQTVTGKKIDFRSDFGGFNGFIGTLSDKVECDAKYRSIIEFLMGRTALFDNVENAVIAARKTNYRYKIVTLEGEVLNPGGSITGGSMARGGRFLQRVKEIKELGTICAGLQKSIDESEDTIDKNTELLYEYKEKLDKDIETEGEMKNRMVKLESERELLKRLVSKDSQQIERMRDELRHIEEGSKTSGSEASSLSKQISQYDQHIGELDAQIEEIKSEIHSHIIKKEDVNREIINIRLKISEINSETDLKRLAEKRETEARDICLKKVQALRQSIFAAEGKIDEYSLNINNKKLDISEAKARIDDYNSRVCEMSESRSRADKDILKLKEETVKQNELVNSLRLELDRLANRLEKSAAQKDEIIARLWDEYELTPNQAFEKKGTLDNLPLARKRLSQLKSEMKALGNINLDAIQEYKSVKERHDFLSGQVEDMESSKKELLSLIKELTSGMKKQFAEKFEIINSNFVVVFAELFGGGSANLSLTDSENILESGIEIEVRPPGKKLQRLSLLSGGEMALTAIALLFAILKVRTSPFCILDEIEAALDDNNIDRFGSYIKNFSDKTQFIIVTHRRGTMATADRLYGVTMQEKGISKLLTMNLDEVAQA